jgi:hypothetical protein
MNKDTFIYVTLIASGGMWLLEYLRFGHIELKAGFPVYGINAMICIFIVLLLPVILFCVRLIQKKKR